MVDISSRKEIEEQAEYKIDYGIAGSAFNMPERSVWTCRVCGVDYNPDTDSVPNWFNRKMQSLCFGFKWVKHDK